MAASDHDCFNMAQAAAYSAIVALFPALIVMAALLRMMPDSVALRMQTSAIFSHILPSNAIPLMRGYFAATPGSAKPAHLIFSACIVSVMGASGVIASLMESFRRAYGSRAQHWSFWRRRRVALALVPMSLLPLGILSLMVLSGHAITVWLWYVVTPQLRTVVIVLALIVRWMVAVSASISIIAVIYYKGTPVPISFHRALPGAALATGLWFLTTLGFGFYVTRYASYSQVYGPLGAGIALLVWLYIIALSVISGAEYNAAMLFQERPAAVNTERKELIAKPDDGETKSN